MMMRESLTARRKRSRRDLENKNKTARERQRERERKKNAPPLAKRRRGGFDVRFDSIAEEEHATTYSGVHTNY